MVNYATKSTSFQLGKELLCLAHSNASSALSRLKVRRLPACYLGNLGNLEIEFFF
jgi:hypothetical protein